MDAGPSTSNSSVSDEKKPVENKESNEPNSAIFTVNAKKHGLCHIIRQTLLKDPKVLLAVRLPHPDKDSYMLRIQTTPDYTPEEAYKGAMGLLTAEMLIIIDKFNVKDAKKEIDEIHNKIYNNDG